MTLVERRWPSDDDQGRRYQAFVAEPVAAMHPALSEASLELCDRAVAALSRIGARSPIAWEPVGRLLLRSEGLASSDIEGIRITPRRLLEAQLTAGDDHQAMWVLDNIAAVEAAYDQADQDLAAPMLEQWHRTLMERSTLPSEYVGRYRTVQGWIGGTNPLTAVFVPAPPELIGELMDDLIVFANRRDISPLVQAAILHAQFETIHPFADGNGRIGRVLVGWSLRRREAVTDAVPPLSPQIARRVDQYVYGLWAYRDGRIDEWVTWFADIALASAAHAADLTAKVAQLVERWRSQLAARRSDDTARRLIEVLPASPVVDVAGAASALQVSDRSARRALNDMEERGLLQPLSPRADGPGRPRKHWMAGPFVDLL
jgi:Fic family protein